MTPEEAIYNFKYSKETGSLFWRVSRRGIRRYYNKEAGSIDKDGYRVIYFNQKQYRATTIIWLILYGREPFVGHEIDHINRDKSDDRLLNLRECTHSQNMSNQAIPSSNTSGYKGVSYHKHTNRFRATIMHNKKSIHIGLYNTAEEAAEAYRKKAIELFGEFADIAIREYKDY